jgi:hypothetical protein
MIRPCTCWNKSPATAVQNTVRILVQNSFSTIIIRMTATMAIIAFISVLAILLAPILLIRFRKRWVAAFNLAVTNRVNSRFAARLPGFGILTHVGRKSGRVCRTPVNVFRAPEGFLIALTYGRDSEWVRNVVAAGACQLETRGCSISFPHQPSCMIPLGGASQFLCGSCSGLSARTISCSFLLLSHPARVASRTLLGGRSDRAVFKEQRTHRTDWNRPPH